MAAANGRKEQPAELREIEGRDTTVVVRGYTIEEQTDVNTHCYLKRFAIHVPISLCAISTVNVSGH